MDTKKEIGLAAIYADNLDWIHVSDLKGWKNVVAQVYKVNAIPSELFNKS